VSAAARKYASDPLEFLRLTQLFGDLVESERFVEEYLRIAHAIHTVGVAETLAQLAEHDG
jgi:hypothetical protein